MNTTDVPMPIRIPELGPHMGRLVSENEQSGVPALDTIRLKMVSNLFEILGDARMLAAEGDREGALRAVGADAWLSVWESVAARAADEVLVEGNSAIGRAAKRVRIPGRLARKYLPGPNEARLLRSRLGATGVGLVEAVEMLEPSTRELIAARVTEREKLERWQDALTRTARRLEGSWGDLQETVQNETARWNEVARHIGQWKKPVWPVVVLFVIGESLAVWVGLVTGGYIDSPPWFSKLWVAVSGLLG